MSKLYHHEIQLDAEIEQLLEEVIELTGLNIHEVFEKGLLSLKQQLHSQPVYHDLDALAGTWTAQQADEFLGTLADFSKIDEELWH